MTNVLKFQEYLYESSNKKHSWVKIDPNGSERFAHTAKLPTRIRVGTDQYKVIRFIYNSGHEGRKYTDIVKYLLVTDRRGSYDHKRDRGYWSSQLSGTWKHPGILTGYCKKNENGRWVLTNRSLVDHFNDEKAKKLGTFDSSYSISKDIGLFSGDDFYDPDASIDWKDEDDLSDL